MSAIPANPAMSYLQSPYPPSFSGSVELYMIALGSLTALSLLDLMTSGWMARDIWRDRRYVHPSTALTAFRATIMIAAFTGFIRRLPEAVYMYGWNELTIEQLATVLTLKRLADAFAIVPGTGWVMLLVLSYPTIANALKNDAARGTELASSWPNLVRPGIAVLLIFTIAPLVAFSKLYLGTTPR